MTNAIFNFRTRKASLPLTILAGLLLTFTLTSVAQNRDTKNSKDYANVFWNPQFTLFDLLTDEPIYPQVNGKYKIWYSSNEDPKPYSKECTPQELQGLTFYKFKTLENCQKWCDSKTGNKTSNSKSLLPKNYTLSVRNEKTKLTQAYIRETWKYGVIDDNKNVVIDFKYDAIDNSLFEYSPIIYVRNYINKEHKYGFVNRLGEEVVPLIYDDARGFNEGFCNVAKGDKWGYIDTTGKEVITFKFDMAYGFHSGLAGVKIGNKWGYINKTGKLVIPATYDKVYDFSDGYSGTFASVKLGNQEFEIDKTGKKNVKQTEAMQKTKKEIAEFEEKTKYNTTKFCFSNSSQSQSVTLFDKTYHSQFETGLEEQPATVVIKTSNGVQKTIQGTWIIRSEGVYGPADFLTITFTGANSQLGKLKFLVLRDNNGNTQTLQEITRKLNYEKCN